MEYFTTRHQDSSKDFQMLQENDFNNKTHHKTMYKKSCGGDGVWIIFTTILNILNDFINKIQHKTTRKSYGGSLNIFETLQDNKYFL